MTGWGLGLLLASFLQGLELDCASPAAARNLIGRVLLSEIEWTEDVNRAAMWEAFGRCPAGPSAEACRDEQRETFGAELDRKLTALHAKYEQVLRDFEERCRASIT